MYSSDIDLVYVQQRLAEGFNLDELKTLCVMLDINHENVKGETLNAKTRELVIHCYRHGLLPELLEEGKKLNQSIDWSKAYGKVYRQTDLPEEWVEPMQQLYRMTKDFNRNRARSGSRMREGDEIAFRMREIAPFVFELFDVGNWLENVSIGKRLAAVKYLDWAQDVEFFDRIVPMLHKEEPFLQFHVLITLDGMLDQLDADQRALLQEKLEAYQGGDADSNREYWRKRMLKRLKT